MLTINGLQRFDEGHIGKSTDTVSHHCPRMSDINTELTQLTTPWTPPNNAKEGI